AVRIDRSSDSSQVTRTGFTRRLAPSASAFATRILSLAASIFARHPSAAQTAQTHENTAMLDVGVRLVIVVSELLELIEIAQRFQVHRIPFVEVHLVNVAVRVLEVNHPIRV